VTRISRLGILASNPSGGDARARTGFGQAGGFAAGQSASTTYLFNDEFDGAASSAPDSSKWSNVDGMLLDSLMSYSKAANAFLNGSGQLVLRITREAWHGKAYAGASIGTYQYATGWPPSPILASWPVPFRYATRFLLPNVAAAWVGPGWNQNVDRTTSQNIYELDLGETRTTFPTVFGANQHTWLSGSDTAAANGSGTGTDGRTNWHTMTMDATSTGTTYYLDGTLIASYYGVSGTFGLQLQNEIADAGSWAAGGSQPDSGDPGPWDMLIDYVRVTAL